MLWVWGEELGSVTRLWGSKGTVHFGLSQAAQMGLHHCRECVCARAGLCVCVSDYVNIYIYMCVCMCVCADLFVRLHGCESGFCLLLLAAVILV